MIRVHAVVEKSIRSVMENNHIMHSLIDIAKQTIEEQYDPTKHTVAAAIRTKGGNVFTSVTLKGQKLDLCSEWSAMVQAVMSKQEIEMGVAVHRDADGVYEIYPPCGLCRELYATYAPEAQVILSEETVVSANELLPFAWKRKR